MKEALAEVNVCNSTIPLVGGLLSVPLPAERYAALTLTPQQQKQQTLDALVAWLAADAERS